MIKTITQCRACSGQLEPVMKLPPIYPSCFIAQPITPPGWERVPLNLLRCERCGLVQLEHSFSPDEMYRQYWYQSALNPTMIDALRDVAECGARAAGLKDGDTVLDIGCNDGTLLACYPGLGLKLNRVGVDPSRNLAEVAARNCEVFINDYFYKNTFSEKARLITAIAMFYDLEDIPAFMEAILTWLADDGVFVIQMTDLLSMLRLNAFDNIVHEHLEYWSLTSLVTLLKHYGLRPFRVTGNEVNGGSLRVFIARSGKRDTEPSVADYLRDEARWLDAWDTFYHNTSRVLAAVKSFLCALAISGRSVAGLGASTKGNTLLQLAQLDASHISSIGEVSKDKFGYYTVGSGIPIRPEPDVLQENPDYLLILPWHFIHGFRRKLSDRNLLVPLPVPRLNETVLW